MTVTAQNGGTEGDGMMSNQEKLTRDVMAFNSGQDVQPGACTFPCSSRLFASVRRSGMSGPQLPETDRSCYKGMLFWIGSAGNG